MLAGVGVVVVHELEVVGPETDEENDAHVHGGGKPQHVARPYELEVSCGAAESDLFLVRIQAAARTSLGLGARDDFADAVRSCMESSHF